MINKIEAFYDSKDGKENILDDDLYVFAKEHQLDVAVALLMQIVRELKRGK